MWDGSSQSPAGVDRKAYTDARLLHRASDMIDAEMLARLPLKAKMLSVREAFNKKISSTEQFLKVQTEANVELANRIKDLVPASQIFSRVSPPAP